MILQFFRFARHPLKHGQKRADARIVRRFIYKLEPVRRIRQQEEQLVQVELAAVLRQRAQADERLQGSRQAEQDMYTWLRNGGLSAAELAHVARYDELHRRTIVDAEHHLLGIDQTVARVRQRLAEARQRSEALERLHDRELARHKVESLAEEARDLDEIASMRAARRRVDDSVVTSGGWSS